jgi:hypothetical protein
LPSGGGNFFFPQEENAEAAKLSIPFLKLATGSFKMQAKMFEMPKRHYSWLCYSRYSRLKPLL